MAAVSMDSFADTLTLGILESCHCPQPIEFLSSHRGHARHHEEESAKSHPLILPEGHHEIFDRFYLAVLDEKDQDPNLEYFSVEGVLWYEGFCDDFGPMNLCTVYQFCNIVEDKRARHQNQPIFMRTSMDSQKLTNAVFLVGAYMIMKLGAEPATLLSRFTEYESYLLSYRDVCPGAQNFELLLIDCWSGLWKAKNLSWVNFNRFDWHEYKHYDDPMNADLHEVVPGKFIAMRGPKDLPDSMAFQDVMDSEGRFSHRDFSPSHFAKILAEIDAKAVFRLNSPEYEREGFISNGIAVLDLFFQDCTCPPADVVAKFLAASESIPGPIAVHCRAGLGRTGTLIGLYMMKHHGFTAREAIGWLRIVRPGSVIGDQQRFLCAREVLMHRAGDNFRRAGGVLPAPRPSARTPHSPPHVRHAASPPPADVARPAAPGGAEAAPSPAAAAAKAAATISLGEVQRRIQAAVCHVDSRMAMLLSARGGGPSGGGSGGGGGGGGRRHRRSMGDGDSDREAEAAAAARQSLPVGGLEGLTAAAEAAAATAAAEAAEALSMHVAAAANRRRATAPAGWQ